MVLLNYRVQHVSYHLVDIHDDHRPHKLPTLLGNDPIFTALERNQSKANRRKIHQDPPNENPTATLSKRDLKPALSWRDEENAQQHITKKSEQRGALRASIVDVKVETPEAVRDKPPKNMAKHWLAQSAM